jgi:hypothetical protein
MASLEERQNNLFDKIFNNSMKKIITGIIGVVIMGAVYFAYTSRTPHDNVQKACTMEAKLCPDGSAVGRSGPNCEFAPCPTAVPAGIAKADLAEFTTPWRE